ncbi:hypothetical protein [Ponticoccus litoralis]|uniref:Uncharacterized protein n=1 Tax=Ponticoccus litoralis TaxID=422297 RepID=A0AAW9SRR7_9RHOB
MLAEAGATVELAFPDRRAFPDVGSSNAAAHLRKLYAQEIVLSPDLRLQEVYQEDNRLVAVLANEYSRRLEERVVDLVVSEQGTTPVDDLFHRLKVASRNHGEIDHRALLTGRTADDCPQPGRRLHAVPPRGLPGKSEHPCGDLRRAAPLQGHLTRLAAAGRDRTQLALENTSWYI